ncbi:MAG: ABC transporter substrate-binding protein [Clostridia bacterium]|nr:ABC transporter substrate-binding protein [Clostridia bacterium]
MKKFFAIVLCLVTAVLFVSCEPVPKDDSGEAAKEYVLMAPDGAPAVAIAQILKDGKVGNVNINASIVSGADEIVTNATNGTADIAVMPVNLAARVYNLGAKIKFVSVNVSGCLYMVGKTAITTVNDLVGKVVYNIGRGGTPDLTLKYILTQSGIAFEESETAVEGKVALQYVAAASELVPLLKTGKAEFGVMGEPAVTNCNAKAGTQTVLDIQAEWKKLTGEDYTQAGLVVADKVAENADFMQALIEALENSNAWCKENAASIKDILSGKGSSLTVDFTAEIIERSNVGYVSAAAARENVEKYLNVIKGFNDKLIGGKLPDDGFYYGI